MIQFNKGNYFHLQTKDTSYIVKIMETGHIQSVYYGRKIHERDNYDSLNQMFDGAVGLEPSYSKECNQLFLNDTCLEHSTYGKSDLREPSLHITLSDNTRVTDFKYISHEISSGKKPLDSLPHFFHNNDNVYTLIIYMSDEIAKVDLELHYNAFYDSNCITRHVEIINNGDTITLERVMSFNLDFHYSNYDLINLYGHWIKEKNIQRTALTKGIHITDSKRLASGADHTPFFALTDPQTTEHIGDAYGFSLVYSGNYQSMIQVNTHDITRVQMGINPFDFAWQLLTSDRFISPEAVMTFSHNGLNGMSQNFHQIILNNLITPSWQGKTRPILFNSWEAMYFDFNESKLLKLANEGKNMGMELFVLDDGWFDGRDDDTTSLGDWYEDTKKLPSKLEGLSKKVHNMGLQFGLWVEPEMISEKSNLYNEHENWVIKLPNRQPSPGRNQLILDLANPEVIDYLYDVLSSLFKRAEVDYVKWDMNRSITDIYSSYLSSDNQKSIYHRYYLGLYDLLQRLRDEFPDVLFESCASGGNRHDLGMLYYMPQTWASDDTDANERVCIQYGGSLLFPPVTMGAHVGSNPSHQTLRMNDIETRYNVAAFGALGYELNLLNLSVFDRKTILKQVEHYKQFRETFQFGKFYRLNSPFENNTSSWMAIDENNTGILGYYQQIQKPNGNHEKIRLAGLNKDTKYNVETREHYINVGKFGDLINHVLPFNVTTSGVKGLVHKTISNTYMYEGEKQKVSAYGDELMYAGLMLYNQFIGTGLTDKTMLVGDFGSRMYNISADNSLIE